MSLKLEPRRDLSLVDLLDRILDKGIVINGDISLSGGKGERLSLKINLVIASLETAKRYGLRLPWETLSKGWERRQEKAPTRLSTMRNYKGVSLRLRSRKTQRQVETPGEI